ncbi:MAG: hypothetical protein K8H87_17080, partial [Pseudorhodoplanes sp.]|nr:hypothetical protein [Pseudorhodoplanes sp.]
METVGADLHGRAIGQAQWAALRASADPAETSDILLRYQRRLLETTALHQVTLCEKSRRTGMTWAAAADAVLTASAARDAGGMDVFYMGYNLDMAREFIDTAAMWAESFGEALTEIGVEPYLFDDAGTPIQAFRIRFASGYEIRALASRPRSLRGLQGYLILDEAAFHDSLQQVVDAASRPGGAATGNSEVLIGNPDGVTQAVYGDDNAAAVAANRAVAPSGQPWPTQLQVGVERRVEAPELESFEPVTGVSRWDRLTRYSG